MSKKYIIANIKIPIEILENGTTNPLMERCEIGIDNCETLPPENKNNNNLFIEKLNEFINKTTYNTQHNTIENKKVDIFHNIFVHKDEIKPHTKSHSLVTTFKNYPTKKINRFTVKNKNPKKEMVVDSIEYKEVQG